MRSRPARFRASEMLSLLTTWMRSPVLTCGVLRSKMAGSRGPWPAGNKVGVRGGRAPRGGHAVGGAPGVGA